MLIIELRVNHRIIKTIGIHNVHPVKLSQDFQGECTYDVYDFSKNNKKIGQLQHKRSNGAEVLAAKALELVAKSKK